ncbi:hypothetical protein B0I32_1071 [Nonomuraea fuscirosea]|uniref:Uncharacterized protein n=1 Tax=Nonomuraea fuscirosea TaxID=1291556 RepID=A0A2T0N084_9ACTN|nr:hypothetical protein B0I32_1071 [Nonomuraea fuscirosea]
MRWGAYVREEVLACLPEPPDGLTVSEVRARLWRPVTSDYVRKWLRVLMSEGAVVRQEVSLEGREWARPAWRRARFVYARMPGSEPPSRR